MKENLSNRRNFEERGFVTGNSDIPDEFRLWWNPTPDPVHGSIGGHDHAPKWMQGVDGRFGWSSGITAEKAWQLQCYQDEYRESKTDRAQPGTGIFYALYNSHKPPAGTDPKEYEQFRTRPFNFKQAVQSLADKFDINKACPTPKMKPATFQECKAVMEGAE